MTEKEELEKIIDDDSKTDKEKIEYLYNLSIEWKKKFIDAQDAIEILVKNESGLKI